MPSTASKFDNSDNLETVKKPTWNTSTNTFATFLNKLRKWLAKKNNNYKTLVEYGYVVNRNMTCFMTDNHIDRYQHGTIPKGTFADPCRIDRTTVDLNGLPAHTAAQWTAIYAADPARAQRLKVNPETIDDVMASMQTDILSCIEDEGTAEEWNVSSSGDPLALLVLFEDKLNEISTTSTTSNIGSSILKKIAALEAEGLSEPSVEAFNYFKTELTDLIETLPDNLKRANGPSIVSFKLVEAVKSLGGLIEIKINNELRFDKAVGNLSKTRNTIVNVLSSLEREDKDQARALIAKRRRSDPRRDRSERTDDRRDNRRAGSCTTPSGGDDKPWETRDWRVSDGPCGHCTFLGKPESTATHWRLHCKHKAEALAAKKAAREKGDKPPTGNGRGAMGRGTFVKDDDRSDKDDEDDPCSECEDDDADAEAFASPSRAGTTTLLDAGTINDPKALLATLNDRDRKDAPAPPAAAVGRAAMGRRGDGDARSRVSRPKFYVIPYAPPHLRGIYYGRWVEDGIEPVWKGTKRGAGSAHTSAGFSRLGQAADYAGEHGADLTFRGPLNPPASSAHSPPFIGNSVIGLFSFENNSKEDAHSDNDSGDEHSSRPANSDGSDRSASSPIYSESDELPEPDEPPAIADQPPVLGHPAGAIASIASAAAPVAPAQATPPSLPLELWAADVPGRASTPGPAVYPGPVATFDYPARVRLRARLTELYRYSIFEGVSQPPMTKNYGKRDAFNGSNGRELFRGQRGKVARWMAEHVAPSGQAARDASPVQAGSRVLRTALIDVRSIIDEMFILARDDCPESDSTGALSALIHTDFAAAREAAVASPVRPSLIGAAVSPEFYALAISWGSRIIALLLNVAIAMIALHLVPSLSRDPGSLRGPALEIGAALAVASLPALLLLLSLLFCRILVGQAKPHGAVGLAPAAGSRPRGPSGHSNITTRTYRDVWTQHSSSAAGYTRRSLGCIAILSAPSFAAATVVTFFFLLVSASFVVGSRIIGCRHPPSAVLFLSRPPAVSVRSPVPVSRVLGGTTRFARTLRRLPQRAAWLIFTITLVTCLGWHAPPPPDEPPPPSGYRANCDFRTGKSTEYYLEPSAREPRHGRALNNRLNLTPSTRRALLNRRRTAKSSGKLDLVVDSGCTMHCHPYEEDLINRRPSL